MCYHVSWYQVAYALIKYGVSEMKKNVIFFIIIVTMLVMSGCKAADEAAFFIPTPALSQGASDEDQDGDTSGESGEETGSEDVTDSDEPVYTGKTTTKYVKLTGYDAILNIRKTPSRDGEIVGFLVHTEQVDVISIEDGWASFVYQNEIRYVSADFLVDKKPAYITPPTPTPTPSPTAKPDSDDVPLEI